MSSMTLREKTIHLLVTRPKGVTFAKIAADTGLSLGWIYDICYKKTADPSADKIQILYEYLSGSKLSI